ncbi:ParA family protein [Paucibacter sp. DJ1R-11]|uniref:ParA family protein n=1 Tax=Paucibacter sp. DJ1R-11 TaxID=2893556 RepID=UPI0021E3724E|nr:ParA family protein [Paucibacter sp. DJ1R-11]MCV2361980.1 ParA family protein [Paucibacter sp. DJ1R-11]
MKLAHAHSISICNRKGGSGKSSTAVNLAAEMAAAGQKVLLIDLDTQGHGAIGLGIQLPRKAATVHGALAGRNGLREGILASRWAGLDLLPADTLADHGAAWGDEQHLRRALEAEGVLADYDLVLLDSPPSLDGLLLNALCAADQVLVPFLPHFLSADGVKQLARVILRVASRGLNERLRVLGYLPVMLDARIGQHRLVNSSLAQQFGGSRLLPGIRSDIRVAEAFGAGVPVRVHAPKSRAAADYQTLAEVIKSRVG